jgi:predicted O-methyltransferase YrrM
MSLSSGRVTNGSRIPVRYKLYYPLARNGKRGIFLGGSVNGFVGRSAKKFIREVKSPGDALRFFSRMLLPVDPHVLQCHSWIWGRLPRLELSQVMPGIESVSIEILEAYNRALGTTLDIEEVASLLAIVKFSGAKKILEIGTFDGGTALNLAANTSSDAHIVTIDLPPTWNGDFSLSTPKNYQNVTDRMKVGRRFLNTPHEKKIEQVFGDSATIDWSKLPGPFDVVFIDGCHSYDYVAKDTQNALKYARMGGGLIIWHDYGYFKDVSDVVDEISTKIKVRAIAGTRLAVGFVGVRP